MQPASLPTLLVTTLVLSMAQSPPVVAQLPLRIDVTWFERHDEWKRLHDAFYDDAKSVDDVLNDAAVDEDETDRHTQQVPVVFLTILSKKLKESFSIK